MKNNDKNSGAIPVVSLVLILIAITLSASVAWTSTVGRIGEDITADSEVKYEPVNQTAVKITLVNKMDSDLVKIYKYNSSSYNQIEKTYTLIDDGDFIIDKGLSSPFAASSYYRTVARKGGEIVVVENVIVDTGEF